MKNKIEYSRLKCFQNCPLKHHYIYNEQIRADKNEFILLGSLFHNILEHYYSGDIDLIDDDLKEYKGLCQSQAVSTHVKMMEEVFNEYRLHYLDSDRDEEILCVEAEFTDDIDKDNEFYLRIDRLVHDKKRNLVILRDTKTTVNALKYKFEDVNFNQQLLTYVPFVENELNLKIDAIEIDEVRLARLEQPLINKNGKPTSDKRKLGLVTLEEYTETLKATNCFGKPEYNNAIEYMEKRGHPLFNRIQAPIFDRNIIDSNLQDMFSTFKLIQTDKIFRHRSPLCNYCGYKELCNLDRTYPDQQSRDMIIDKIKNS